MRELPAEEEQVAEGFAFYLDLDQLARSERAALEQAAAR
jgi:hypothetical protein